MIKKIIIIIVCLLGVIALFVVCSILPIERYDYHTKDFYSVMMNRLDSLKKTPKPKATQNFSVGFAKVNLTPSKRTATAGYGNRRGKLYTAVHDSIFVRAMVITNGNNRVAIVSADLLILPPSVTSRLAQILPGTGFTLDNIFLGAIHSHNSIGNWGVGLTGFMYGDYDETIVHFIADKIKNVVLLASKNCLPATVKTEHILFGQAVRNRLDDQGVVDSILHVVEVTRSDSSKAVLMNYTAHATCLYSSDLELSRDYPGKLVDELESHGYDFAMFMAGAVGSHRYNSPVSGWPCVDWMADAIVTKFEHSKHALVPLKDTSLIMYRIPLELGKAQVKISKDWCVRPWLFRAAFGKSENYLTALRVGDLVMLGTPCDYSGTLTSELYSLAKKKGLQVMISSFNGGYIGYVTPLQYYDSTHYETRLMNWYGPGSGEYLKECMNRMIDAVASKK